MRVLSIQSAVTLGAVGNTIAAPVFASLGVLAARLDTIQLAAHPGHLAGIANNLSSGSFAGVALDADVMLAMVEAIDKLGGFATMDALISGYHGSAGQIDATARAIRCLRHQRPDAVVVIDPAVGDHDQLYVAPAVATAIRDRLLPMADLITPNRFELAWLSGMAVETPNQAAKAAGLLLQNLPDLRGIAVTGITGTGITSQASTESKETDRITDLWLGRDDIVHFSHQPALRYHRQGVSGGGDLFAALLLGLGLCRQQDWLAAFSEASRLAGIILQHADNQAAAGEGGHGDINLASLPQLLSEENC